MFNRWLEHGRTTNNKRAISELIRNLQQTNIYDSNGNRKRVRSWAWSEEALKFASFDKKNKPEVDRKKVTVDHPVTVEHTIQFLWSNFEKLSIEDITDVVYKNSRTVVITKEEDSVLNSKGLRSKMPENFEPENFLARYEGVLEVVVNPFKLNER